MAVPAVLIAIVLTMAVAAAVMAWPLRDRARQRTRTLRDGLAGRFRNVVDRWGWPRALAAWFLGWYLALLAVTVGIGTLVEVVGSGPGTVDRQVLSYFVERRTDELNTFMRLASDVGDSITLMILGVVAAVVWRLRRQEWHGGLALVASFGGVVALYNAAKVLVSRARPDLEVALFEAPGLSFPSGHTTGSTAFYVALALVVATLALRWMMKVWILAGGLTVVAMIATSRLYLAPHGRWSRSRLSGHACGKCRTGLSRSAN